MSCESGRRGDPERGVTLVETLIAMVILGLTVAALLTGFAASIRAGRIGREIAKAETVQRTFVENVVHIPQGSETDGFRACTSGTPPTYAPLTQDGYVAQVVAVQYWVDGSDPASFGGCANDASGLQRVTVRVTPPNGSPLADTFVFMRKTS
jgi:prepilin-type N-terminal cleavage/methylation domain-containing protein